MKRITVGKKMKTEAKDQASTKTASWDLYEACDGATFKKKYKRCFKELGNGYQE